MATVINHLESGKYPNEDSDKQVFRLAHRIAVNRTVAGLHFPVDSAAGAALGCAIGSALIALAQGTDKAEHRVYSFKKEDHYGADNDFHQKAMRELVSSGEPANKPKAVSVSDIYVDYWKAAREEWS